MLEIILLVTAIATVWWVLSRQGKLKFWQIAKKHPDAAYALFSTEDCWYVGELPPNVNRSDVMGPFRLYVPSLNQTIKVYGRFPDFEESQELFIREVQKYSR